MTDEAVAAGRRRAHRLLLMVGELHKRGYQQLRICPAIAPSGMYWRCPITPASNVQRDNGARLTEWTDELVLPYTSGDENNYFGWGRLPLNARQLADLFEQRFPRLCEAGRGRDWEYAGWFVEMLGFAEQGFFPYASADYYEEPPAGTMHVANWAGGEDPPRPLPAPPPVKRPSAPVEEFR